MDAAEIETRSLNEDEGWCRWHSQHNTIKAAQGLHSEEKCVRNEKILMPSLPEQVTKNLIQSCIYLIYYLDI